MILVVSYKEEEHTIDVVKRLEKKGRDVILADLSDFPSVNAMSFQWHSNGKQPSFIIEHSKGRIDLNKINVAWWRRVRPFLIDTSITDTHNRVFAESETSQAINGVFDSLPCQWINPRAADDAAHHKPLQWSVAKEIGLRIPKTLVTTEPNEALKFINETKDQKTVYKAFLASIEAWRETRLIKDEDLAKIDSVKYAPVIFQEYIAGVDLRITIVGDKIFAAEIDAQNTSYPVDMRMVIGETQVKAIDLPAGIKKLLLKLQERLGLYYGAIDMRKTKDNEYFFLEVNPAGQWLFVEERTGLPISEAVADLLCNFDK